MSASPFTAESLKFLRGLARHNDREWFEARREIYERALKSPLLALVEQVNQGMADFAPGHIRAPAKTAMRIYRDTRFSKDKRPYKTHVGAWWAERGTERTTGAGFYAQVNADHVTLAAGAFVPSAPQLLALRRWLAEHHASYRTQLETILSGTTEPRFTVSSPHTLRRVPRGFTADHSAADLLRATRWGVELTLPAERALEPGFGEVVLSRFREAAPLVLALAEAFKPAGTGT